jgi:phosphatidylglycerophosphate synthase
MSDMSFSEGTRREITGLARGDSGKQNRPCRNGPTRQAVLDASQDGAWENVGGLPLIARSLYWMRKLGVEECVVVSSENGAVEKLDKWRGSVALRGTPAQIESSARPGERGSVRVPKAIRSLADLDEWFLYIDCSHLIDPRIIQSLAAARESTLAFLDPADRQSNSVRAGLLNGRDLELWAAGSVSELIESTKALFPDDIDPFSPELRGPLRPYFATVRTSADARDATRFLVCSQQKHVMDLPAEFIDPPFENALTILLCGTPVTPNMVTAAGACFAALVAWLFWNAHFAAGAFLTFAVEILDGVDGKLARTKLHFSKLGQHEEYIDYLCETGWYVSLGVGLSAAGWNMSAIFAGLLIVSDTLDNILYTFAGKWYGKSIDLFSPFDSAFRRIAGRRNIYGFMFMAGFSVGLVHQTFAAVAAWAFITACIHGVRLFQFGRLGKERIAGETG